MKNLINKVLVKFTIAKHFDFEEMCWNESVYDFEEVFNFAKENEYIDYVGWGEVVISIDTLLFCIVDYYNNLMEN